MPKLPSDSREFTAKVESFESPDFTFGVRISYLFDDRGPEIYEAKGFPNAEIALDYGKEVVKTVISRIPSAKLTEHVIQ